MRTRRGFQCIYAGFIPECAGSLLESAEHCLPRGLGKFLGSERLRGRVCAPCNQELGKVHDVFLHTGPEAICRELMGLSGRKKHRPKNPYMEQTHKVPPIDALGKFPGTDMDVLWESASGGAAIQVIPQIVITNPSEIRRIRLTPEMRSYDCFSRVLKSEGTAASRVAVMVPEKELAMYQAFLARFYGNSIQNTNLSTFSSGGSTTARMLFTPSPDYYRAVAVIGFHFLLSHCKLLSGLEPQFAGLKKYIASGGDRELFLKCGTDPLMKQVGLFQCSHLLSLKIADNAINVILIYFAGIGSNFVVWKLTIPAPETVISMAAEGWAYSYYPRGIKKKDFDGELLPLMDQRCRVPPLLKLNLLNPQWPTLAVDVFRKPPA